MTNLRLTKSAAPTTPEISSKIDSMLSYRQESLAESRLYQYQLEQQTKVLETLEQKVGSLEIHHATQLGQDKIIGFLVGAVVLSLLSLVTTLFFRPSELQSHYPNLESVSDSAVLVESHQNS